MLAWRPGRTNLKAKVVPSLTLAVGREDGSVTVHDLLPKGGHGDGEGEGEAGVVPTPVVMRDHVGPVTCALWSDHDDDNDNDQEEEAVTTATTATFFTAGRDEILHTYSISNEDVPVTDTASGNGKNKKKRNKKNSDGTSTAQVGTTVVARYRRIRTLPVYEAIEGILALPSTSEDEHDVLLATCGSKGRIRFWGASYNNVGGKGSASQKRSRLLAELTSAGGMNDGDAFGEEGGGYKSMHLVKDAGGEEAESMLTLAAADAEHNLTFWRMLRSDDENKMALVPLPDRTIVGHSGEVLDVKVIPPVAGNISTGDAHTIAVATNGPRVRLFGLTTTGGTTGTGISSLSPRGILGGGENNNNNHTATVLSVDASPCGRYVATAGKDRTCRIWDVASKNCVAVATGHAEAVGSCSLSCTRGRYDMVGKSSSTGGDKVGGGAFVVTASKDRTIKLWGLPGSKAMDRCAKDGMGVVGAQQEKEQEPIELKAAFSAVAHEKDINIVTVAPNDTLIATGSQDKTARLWRASDLSPHGRPLRGHKRGVWDCRFGPRDRVLATASGDRTIKLWSLADCGCVRTFQGHVAGVLRVRFLGTGLQMISSGSDGLLKLWTIRTNECETTLDGHADKAWALDLSPDGTALFSGGADSKIAVWRDATEEREDARRVKEERNVMLEQKLANHLRSGRFEKALGMALELDKPHQALKVLTEIVEKDAKKNLGVETLQRHAKNWSPQRLLQILRYCREWNSRARNCHIAMMVVKAVTTTVPVGKLASIDGVPEVLASIAPYAERHFARLDGLVAGSYLLDFTLRSMGSLHGVDVAGGSRSGVEGYAEWAARSKYVLPPTTVDGRVQVGGSVIVGSKTGKMRGDDGNDSSDGDEGVISVGESDTSDDEDGGESISGDDSSTN